MIQIIIKGNPIVKKNTAKTSVMGKDKNGRLLKRVVPVHWYTDAYKEWHVKLSKLVLSLKTSIQR